MAYINKYEHQYKILNVLRIGLGIFFLYVGIRKLFRISPFIDDIARFEIVPIAWEPWVAYLGIACEIALGICFLSKRLYSAAVSLALGMCATFIIIFVQGWMRGLTLSCNCLGVERMVTSYPFEVFWRLALFSLVGILFWEVRKQSNIVFQKGSKLPIRTEY